MSNTLPLAGLPSPRGAHPIGHRRGLAAAICLSLCSVFSPSVARGATDEKLAARLDAVLGSVADTGATYVARVVDPTDGRELYAHDADRPVAPASNMKLPTTAAALDRFGPGFRWRTYLAVDGDDLWIVGTGDPACGDRRIEAAHGRKRFAILDDWADALVKRGVTHVKGKLLFDDGVFDDERVGASWPKAELTESWCAPLSGLTLNGSCISVSATTDRLEVLPHTAGVKVVDRTRRTGKPDALAVDREAAADAFTVKGLVGKREETETKAIVDPGAFFADAVRTKLLSVGITIDGPTERASRATAKQKWGPLKADDRRDPRVVAVHESALRDVLNRTNKQSQNLFADAFCKRLGVAWDAEHGKDAPGSWRAGGEAIHDFLKRVGVDDAKYVLVDGSGMSHDNRLTARLVSDLLVKMSKHRYAAEFRDSLSVCGMDGTLDDRMTDIAGRVHGKSGTIDGVKALSGYLTTRGGRTLAFSMIYNDAPAKVARRCANLMDDACRVMVEWPDVGQATNKAAATQPAKPKN